jgi:hypothetical protein
MYYSQIGQDEFVCTFLKNKKNGSFLDIGCRDYKIISNTYHLESELNWNGIGIDINCSYQKNWVKYRKSIFICADALNLNYKKVLEENNMPKIIDYLSIDLEPPVLALQALKKIFETDYSFNVVTFETDYYRQRNTRDKSRDLLKKAGFIWVREVKAQDDFYIHSRLL